MHSVPQQCRGDVNEKLRERNTVRPQGTAGEKTRQEENQLVEPLQCDLHAVRRCRLHPVTAVNRLCFDVVHPLVRYPTENTFTETHDSTSQDKIAGKNYANRRRVSLWPVK